MTNINITIPEDLHTKLKVNAAQEQKTLKNLIIQKLTSYAKEERL